MGNMMKRISAEKTESDLIQMDNLAKTLKTKPALGEKLMRNVLVAALLLCCVVSARDIAVSPDKTVLDVLQSAVESEWDENLGRLVYVNGALSDAIAVFSDNRQSALYSPCNGEAIGMFTQDTPYIVYEKAGKVFAAAGGEVLSVSSVNESVYSVRIQSDNGVECLYHGLRQCSVSEGDAVAANAVIGSCGEERLCFEMRRYGAAVDASAMLMQRSKE